MERPASELLHRMIRHGHADTISLQEIKEALHERGFGILLVIFVIPCCLPVPVPPGVPFIFSIPLIFLSIQMLLGLDTPWLPKWLAAKSFKRKSLSYMIEKASPILHKIERILHPRLPFASTRRGERVLGAFIFVLSCVIALPLPIPFSNFVPGIGILIMSLGLMSKDGLVIILGMIIGLAGAGLIASIMIFGIKVVNGFVTQIFG